MSSRGTDRIGKVVGYGVAGLLAGLGFGAIASMKGSLDAENRKHHNSLQILEDYDPELLRNFLELSVMQDRHGDNFSKMHRALGRLLTIEIYADQLPKRSDWGRTAHAYSQEIVKRCNRLLEHVDDYDDADNLEKYLDQIKNIAADLTHNALVVSNEQLYDQEQ